MPALAVLAALLSAVPDSLLVSPEWLAARLGAPRLVVLQTAMGRGAYDRGHVPGARFASVMDFHAHHGDQLPPVARLQSAVEALGITTDDHVVLVGDPMSTALMFVALDYLGHGDRTSVLDGGFPAWREAGGAISTSVPDWGRSRFEPRVKTDMVVTADWIAGRLGRPGTVLLDARSEAEYLGTTEVEGLPRYGHIPGARHLDWLDTFRPEDWTRRQDGRIADEAPTHARLRPAAELRQRFVALGGEPGTEVVTYCTVGMRASQLYFVARMLGYRARLYVGSMSDWSRRADLPVAGPTR